MILIENLKKNPCRFAGESALRQLPVWVRPHVNKYDVFGRAIRDMIVFFKTAEQTVSFILINVYLLVIYFFKMHVGCSTNVSHIFIWTTAART